MLRVRLRCWYRLGFRWFGVVEVVAAEVVAVAIF